MNHNRTLKHIFIIICCVTLISTDIFAQPTNRVMNIFPKGTLLYDDLAYANDTLKKHQLDIYEPAGTKESYPVVIWIHGGAWMSNDKYADMSYMQQTLRAF